MKKIISLTVAILILSVNVLPVLAETVDTTTPTPSSKLPYMFKDPTWETLTDGQNSTWPLPVEPGFSTGIYSLASANEVDYKEDEDTFYNTAAKYKSNGNIEVYYKSNPSSSVRLDTPTGGRLVASNGGTSELEIELPKTSVAAYNEATGLDQLILEPAKGQWLVTNGFYSRNSTKPIKPITTEVDKYDSTVVDSGTLDNNPWGVMGSSTPIAPEDFLMGLSKSLYGVIQSRPLYIQSTPYRLAKKVTWEVERQPADKDGYSPPPTVRYLTGDWVVQDVSKILKEYKDDTMPTPGQTKIVDRGEYIVHPDGYLNNVYQRYSKDQNSFVSPNVYELYFSKLLQKGILDTATAFANRNINASNPVESTPDNFSFNKAFADPFYSQYHNYGQNSSTGSYYIYPAWAPELGAVYSNTDLIRYSWLNNITDQSIRLMTNTSVLGESYSVKGASGAGVTEITSKDTSGKYMEKSAVIMIDALRLIEKGMRIEDGDMTNTEAALIAKKYGDQYLNTLSDADKRTVSYLLAKGVLNFEKFQEYSNLYTTLNESFAYELLYRVANKDARLTFSKITLTDSDSSFADLVQFSSVMLKPSLEKLLSTDSVTTDGRLTTNGTDTLNVMSDVIVQQNSIIAASNGNITVEISLDDPLKYLYRGKPLVNIGNDGKPILSATHKPYYQVYHQLYNNNTKLSTNIEVGAVGYDTKLILSNAVDKAKGSTGISQISKNSLTGRWDISFVVQGVDLDSATEFVKANLETKIFGISDKVEQTGAYSNGSAMIEGQVSTTNPSLSKNEDLVVNKDYDLTSFTDGSTTVAGNTVLSNASSISSSDKVISSVDAIEGMSNTVATESIGSKTIVNLDIPQLVDNPFPVYGVNGKRIGQTTVTSEYVNAITSKSEKLTQAVNAYNISLYNAADSLIINRTFNFTPKGSKTASRKISGSVILSWDLNLPSKAEQNSLVGNSVTAFTNDNVRSSWIFTEPKNKDLLSLWTYNMGLNKAILKTLKGSGLTLKSGYFSPKIDILVDSFDYREISPDGKQISADLTEEQLREIKNSLAKEIGANIDSAWVKTYIGDSSLANYTIPYPTSGSTRKLSKEIVNKKPKSTSTGITFPLTTLLNNKEIPNGETVWSTLVFNADNRSLQLPTYLQVHSDYSKLNINSIYTTGSGNYYYGHYESGGEEYGPPHMELPYVKDSFGNWYKNFDGSDYTVDLTSKIIREKSSTYQPDQTGSLVAIDNTNWRVVSDTPTSYKVLSKNFIQAMYRDNSLFTLTSGTNSSNSILDALTSYAKKIFAADRDKGIDESKFLSTASFNFVPSPNDITTGINFGAVRGGVLQPMIYSAGVDSEGKPIFNLESANLQKDDIVNVPVFVTLSKNVWAISGDKLFVRKQFAGADPSFYTRGTLVQNIKEQLLSKDSKNIVKTEDVTSGTLSVGSLVGSVKNSMVTFLVPFTTDMLSDEEIDGQVVLDEFNSNAELTLLNNKIPYSATQYLLDKEIASYSEDYKGYNKTLVRKKNKLYVANSTQLTEYVPGSSITTISLTAGLMKGLKLLNMGYVSTENQYSIYSQQDVKPPEKVSPFSISGAPVIKVSGKIVNDTSTMFQKLSTSEDIMKRLQKYLQEIRVKNAWNTIILFILATSLVLSVTTILSHIFAYAPISVTWFSTLLDVTGIDFLSVFSVRAVRVDGENRWMRTVLTSAYLGIGPLVLFTLMVWLKLL